VRTIGGESEGKKRERPATAAELPPSQVPVTQDTSDTDAGALAPLLTPAVPTVPLSDPELARVVAAWPELPAHIKAAVLALVQSAGK